MKLEAGCRLILFVEADGSKIKSQTKHVEVRLKALTDGTLGCPHLHNTVIKPDILYKIL